MSTTAKTVTMKGSPQNKSPATIGTKNQNPTLVQEAKSRITPPLNVDHIITSNRAAEYVFKYIIIGDAGVGKSSLMQQFVNGTFSLNNASTVGVEFGTKNIRIGDNIISLQIWDTVCIFFVLLVPLRIYC
jgi:predicted GTPase